MSKARAKGSFYETLIVDYLKQYWSTAERRVTNGAKDRGDVAGIPNLVLELKNCKKMDLSGWMKEAALEAEHAGVTRWAVVHKRRGVGDPALQYITMPMYLFVELLMESE